MGSLHFYPVTHVIFDLDGLILDTETRYNIAISRLCEKYGSEYTEEAKSHATGRTARDAGFAIIKYCSLPINIDQYMEEIEMEYPAVFKGVEFMPGAERLIRHLTKNSIPIAIATSGCMSNFKLKTVGHKAVFDLFHHIVFGSNGPQVKNGKPAPDIFQVAAARFQVAPENPRNVLVLEDSLAGVRGAIAAGMQVVWVPEFGFDTRGQDCTQLLETLEDFQPECFGLPSF